MGFVGLWGCGVVGHVLRTADSEMDWTGLNGTGLLLNRGLAGLDLS